MKKRYSSNRTRMESERGKKSRECESDGVERERKLHFVLSWILESIDEIAGRFYRHMSTVEPACKVSVLSNEI